MSVHLNRQFDKLKHLILTLGARVEEAVGYAIRAMEQRDSELAKQVMASDRDIDLSEIDVEEECLHTLACYQPVAQDLRFVVAVLKINNDLERIGDLASNIAGQAAALAQEPAIEIGAFGLDQMATLAQKMVKQSLDAMVELDVELAEEVCKSDDEVDALHRQLYDKVEARVNENVELFPQLLRMLISGRHLERIADHAVNIAEDVLYMAKGEIVRHGHPSARA